MALLVGQPLDRVDRMKVTGKATYTADQIVPNLAHGVLVMSSIAKGRITSIPTPRRRTRSRGPGRPHPQEQNQTRQEPLGSRRGRIMKRIQTLQVLQDDRIYYANQPIAIVVAETLEAANEASVRVMRCLPFDAFPVRLEVGYSERLRSGQDGGGEPAESRRGDVSRLLQRLVVRMERGQQKTVPRYSLMVSQPRITLWEDDDQVGAPRCMA